MAGIWWCKSGPNGQNFGDIITPYIYKKITEKDCKFTGPSPNREPVYIGAGSIVGLCQGNVIIWGAGIMNRNERFAKPLKVLSVRGPITRRRFLELGYDCPEVYGDIGLILPRFYAPQLEKKYKLGIIPHYVDYDFCKKVYGSDQDVIVIDLCAGIEKVVDEIVQCERTISSSLHGIIGSHAYGIKCGWVRFSERIAGGFTKYHDYYGSVGINGNLTPKYIKERVEPALLIEYADSYHNPAFPINTDQIMEACPWKADPTPFNIVSDGHPLHVELRTYLRDLLVSLGCRVHINLPTNNAIFVTCHHIVIGRASVAHLLARELPYTLLECDQPGSSTPQHIDVIKKATRVWYFSKHGLEIVKRINTNTVYLPFIYYPMKTASLRPRELDVCLLGEPTGRRDVIIRRLKEEGINIFYSSSCWGNSKAEVLGKTKIVLNIHYHPKSCQEIMRILEGVSAGCLVISEQSEDKQNDEMLSCDYVKIVPYDIDTIVATIKEQLSNLPPPEMIANCDLLKGYRSRLEAAMKTELKETFGKD